MDRCIRDPRSTLWYLPKQSVQVWGQIRSCSQPCPMASTSCQYRDCPDDIPRPPPIPRSISSPYAAEKPAAPSSCALPAIALDSAACPLETTAKPAADIALGHGGGEAFDLGFQIGIGHE